VATVHGTPVILNLRELLFQNYSCRALFCGIRAYKRKDIEFQSYFQLKNGLLFWS
jgi:hypothetical protein